MIFYAVSIRNQQMISFWTANLVWVLHMIFVAWVVLVPWFGSWDMTLLHAMVIPFLFVHWTLNDDTCFLTLLESSLRGVPRAASFMHQLVSPIYKLHDDQTSKGVWVLSAVLWCLSVHRLRTKYPAEVNFAYQTLASYFRP